MKGPFVPGTWWPGTAPPPASSRKWAGAGRAQLSQRTKAVCAQRQPAAPSAGRHPAPRATAPQGTPVSGAGHPPTRDLGRVPLRMQVGVCVDTCVCMGMLLHKSMCACACMCVHVSRCMCTCGHMCTYAASQVGVCVCHEDLCTHVLMWLGTVAVAWPRPAPLPPSSLGRTSCDTSWLQGCLPATVATRPLLYLLQPRGSHEAPCCPQGSRAILNVTKRCIGDSGPLWRLPQEQGTDRREARGGRAGECGRACHSGPGVGTAGTGARAGGAAPRAQPGERRPGAARRAPPPQTWTRGPRGR